MKVSLKDDSVQLAMDPLAKTHCDSVAASQTPKVRPFAPSLHSLQANAQGRPIGLAASPSGKGDTQNLFRYIFSRLAMVTDAQFEPHHGLLAGCRGETMSTGSDGRVSAEELRERAIKRLSKLMARADKVSPSPLDQSIESFDPEAWMDKRDTLRVVANIMLGAAVLLLLASIAGLTAELLRPIGETYLTSFNGEVQRVVPVAVD